MHKLILASEIIGGTITALIAISFLMATFRAMLGVRSRPFNPATDVALAEAHAAKEGWLHRSLVAFDVAVNVIVLRGNQGETISAHAWRASNKGHLWGKLMTKWLDGFQDSHGWRAASGDLERATAEASILRKALGV